MADKDPAVEDAKPAVEQPEASPTATQPNGASAHEDIGASDVRSVKDGNADDASDVESVHDIVDILHEVKCIEEGKGDRDYYQDKPFKGLRSREERLAEKQLCIIAVVRDVYGKSFDIRPGEEREDFYKNRGKLEEIVFGQHFVPFDIRFPFIRIESPVLAALLRSLITYYPSQTLTGKNIEIHYPYESMFNYFPDLLATHENPPSDLEVKDNESWEEDIPATIADPAVVKHHLSVLLSELEPRYHARIQPEMSLIKTNMVKWHYIWLLLKPGIDAYTKIEPKLDDSYAGYVVLSVEQLEADDGGDDPYNRQQRWKVVLWSLQYFGKMIHRRTETVYIPKYTGERDVLSLPVFPAEVFDKKDHGAHRRRLEERGRKYFEIIQREPAHLQHSGYTMEAGSRKYTGEVMIDPRENLNHRLDLREIDYDEDDTPWDRIPADNRGGVKFASYEQIDPKEITAEEFSKHHCFLLPARLLGFALKTKSWTSFHIDNVTDVVFPSRIESMESLVLPSKDLEFIRAVSAHFMTRPRNKAKDSKGQEHQWKPFSADTIAGKGEGQIFLLHGPPGSGKTYTVECLAKFTKRPLLSLTVGDIGNVEDQMEAALALWFSRAESWNAVLLLDEADVFLERRQLADLKRNSLVTVFLRTMEYYSGMLFLTTNRMNQIDDAFVSRIQVALKYHKLDSDARERIWHQYFDRIEENRDDIEITDEARRYVSQNQGLLALQLNGREIRNALQTAINLARYDAVRRIGSFNEETMTKPLPKILVKTKHFGQIVDMRRKFIEDKNSIDQKNEGIRAMEYGDRMDEDAKVQLSQRRKGFTT